MRFPSVLEDMATYRLKNNSKRSHNSTWTDERELKLIEMLENNMDPKDIAETLGVSLSSVKGKMARLECGYVPRIGPTPKEKFIDELLKKKGIK
jgi:DNA-binding CsgD family transcriptional regulator